MRIYTNTFDLATPSPHRFWVPQYSDFKIGVKIVKNGEAVEKDFTVKAEGVALTADETKIDGFTTYTIKSNGTGFVEYSIEVEDVAEKLKLTQIVTDSTVFEVGGSGGGDVPADVATQTWVNSQISDFITEDDLNGYATEDYVDSTISDFVTDDELTAYATKAELTAYAEIVDLTAYATKGELTGYVLNGDLTAYATVDSLSDYAEASTLTAYAEKTDIKDSTITITQGGVTKGSFTLNLATGDTIELDAGGAGSSAISAFDLSESPVWSKTMVENALANNICLPQTIALNNDNSISVVDADGTFQVSWQSGLLTIYAFPNAKKIMVGTKVNTLTGRPRSGDTKEIVLPNTLSAISGAGRFFQGLLKYTKIPDSVVSIDDAIGFTQDGGTGLRVIDFGNTRTTVATQSASMQINSNIKIYVPDALYDTWVASSSWSAIANLIYRHSELEAPYLYENRIEGGALSGTTGTPAAIEAVKSVYETDWASLSATADANTFYVVLPDPA